MENNVTNKQVTIIYIIKGIDEMSELILYNKKVIKLNDKKSVADIIGEAIGDLPIPLQKKVDFLMYIENLLREKNKE
jgi:hypothetical protein